MRVGDVRRDEVTRRILLAAAVMFDLGRRGCHHRVLLRAQRGRGDQQSEKD